MADRAHIPSSPACGQWETLLTDALDGLLKPEDEVTFAEHMAGCKACTALFEEARRGREWLEFLSPEPEVPAGLLDKILAQTGPGQVAGYGLIGGECQGASDASCMAASGLCRPNSSFCRAAAVDDCGDGILFNRADVEFNRGKAEWLAHGRPSSRSCPFLHGTAIDHGIRSDHPLLRSPALCLRSGVEDAGVAA